MNAGRIEDLSLFVLPVQNAWSQEKEAFTQERFEALQAEGALILLDVFADWCPTCAKQQEVLAAYQEERPDVPLHILQIDFDDARSFRLLSMTISLSSVRWTGHRSAISSRRLRWSSSSDPLSSISRSM